MFPVGMPAVLTGPSPDVSVLCLVISTLVGALVYLYKAESAKNDARETWYRDLVEKTLKDNFKGIVDSLDLQGDNTKGLVAVTSGMQQILSEVGRYVQEERWKDAHNQQQLPQQQQQQGARP